MKNDINTLLECSSLSEYHDSATGLYNKRGFEKELASAVKKMSSKEKALITMVRTGVYSDESRIDEKNISVRLDIEISECLKRLANDMNGFCGKLSDKLYVIAAVGDFSEDSAAIIEDKLNVLISHSPLYSRERGLDTLFTVFRFIDNSNCGENLISQLTEEINGKIKQFSEERRHTYYNEYIKVRNSMYIDPGSEWDAQKTCRDFRLSYGHFRATYKDIFGISFHQDLIRSRISMAKYMLLTTSLSLPAIAYKCGYEDDKYFMRQFRQLTGVTPNSYRNSSI